MNKYEAIVKHNEELWDMNRNIPIPYGPFIRCGFCGSTKYIPRHSRWFKRDLKETGYPYRVDVSFKCTYCAAVWAHGLMPSRRQWHAAVDPTGRDDGAKFIRYQEETSET